MSELNLNGLLFSGGPFAIDSPIAKFQLVACTLDPFNRTVPAIVTSDDDFNSDAEYVFSRCVSGGYGSARVSRNSSLPIPSWISKVESRSADLRERSALRVFPPVRLARFNLSVSQCSVPFFAMY